MCSTILGTVAVAISLSDIALAKMVELEEIIVTSQRREQNITDVGIAVTAFTSESIKNLGMSEGYDIAAFTPGLNILAGSGYTGTVSFSLRGIGNNNFSEAGEAGVAVYQDDVYLASLNGSTAAFFDIDRFEVLRGPQGTLFGRSATGGLVHYISKKPTEDFDASIALKYGSHDERHIDMAVGGPLTDSVSYRVSGYWNKMDGWLKNTIGDDQYGEEKYGVRGQVLVNFNEDADFLFKIEYGEIKNENGVVFLNNNLFRDTDGQIKSQPADLDASFTGPGNNFFGYRDRDGDFFTGQWQDNGVFKTDRLMVSGTLNWDIGFATLTSITSYMDTNQLYTDINNTGPVTYLSLVSNRFHDQFIQELRLSGEVEKLTWTVGGFYMDWNTKGDRDNILPIGYWPVIGFNFPANLVMNTKQNTKSISGYAQVEYAVTDEVTAIVGFRAENNKVDFDFDFVPGDSLSTFVFGAPYSFNQALNGDLAKIDKQYYSGTLELDWRPDDNTLVYGSIRRGIKPGGFNVPFGALAPEDFKFEEEKLMAYEMGVKKTLFDGAAQLNASIYYYDYKDYQAVFLESTSIFLTNAGAEIYGLDLEVLANPMEGLNIGLGLALLEGNVENITLDVDGPFFSGPSITRDREVPNAAKYSINIFTRYEWNAFGGVMSLQGDALFQDKIHFEVQNHSGLTSDSFIVANFRVAWQKDNFEIAATAKNIFEEEYVINIADLVDFGGYADVTPGKPRWFGIELRYNFGE
ncbi:TonB-dependent receptor [hydrothermal vent metagenome]|uniref:TonB-dependent receptor n=1 Tax=hydrothermal vent metagenome TaxID=652676 RepID=A0A3B1AXI6_9ZZZZ